MLKADSILLLERILKVEYLIGGAIAEWAWGEPRAIQDLDLVVRIPIKAINKLKKEEPPAPPPELTAEVKLLTEIRDLLRGDAARRDIR